MVSMALICINAILIINTAVLLYFPLFFQGNKIRVMQSISYGQKTVSLHNSSEGKNLVSNRAALTHAGHHKNKNRHSIVSCEQYPLAILLVSPCMSCLSVTPFACTEVRVCQLICQCYGECVPAFSKLTTLSLLETKIFIKMNVFKNQVL